LHGKVILLKVKNPGPDGQSLSCPVVDPPYNNQLAGNAALFSRQEFTESVEQVKIENRSSRDAMLLTLPVACPTALDCAFDPSA
jgi:hypothetical protein